MFCSKADFSNSYLLRHSHACLLIAMHFNKDCFSRAEEESFPVNGDRESYSHELQEKEVCWSIWLQKQVDTV